MKVYGWRGHRGKQTREIVAARSAAEVRRITGMSRGDWEFSGCETGNDEEIALAMTKPGIVFWRELDGTDWVDTETGTTPPVSIDPRVEAATEAIHANCLGITLRKAESLAIHALEAADSVDPLRGKNTP